jgi:putative membrane protein
MRRGLVVAGLILLALLWGGPLMRASHQDFAAHMAVHMGLVAVVAPLLAAGIAGTRFDLSERHPLIFGPLIASAAELVTVWGWHLPALHAAARTDALAHAAEQASFLAVGLWVWTACLGLAGGETDGRSRRAALGTVGLLLTSMHMTLLGALIAFAGRPLYTHGLAGLHGTGVDPAQLIADQQAGGVIMLLGGGLAYLIGGVALMARLFRDAGAFRDTRHGRTTP